MTIIRIGVNTEKHGTWLVTVVENPDTDLSTDEKVLELCKGIMHADHNITDVISAHIIDRRKI